MTRRALALAGLLAAGCGGAQRGGGEAAERPATEQEAAELRAVVLEAQRAGFLRHDVDAYLALWAEDARLVSARQPEPGEHETTLDRAQLEASRRMRFRGDSTIRSLEHDDVSITVAGDVATMRTRTTMHFPGGTETVGERYRLRRTAGGWRAFENRFWRLSATVGGQTRLFDAAFYADADRRVEAERAAGDRYELALALLDAGRPREALAALRELTAQEDVEAYDWVLRGIAAVAVGDAADAEQAFASALALDPQAPVPPYARR